MRSPGLLALFLAAWPMAGSAAPAQPATSAAKPLRPRVLVLDLRVTGLDPKSVAPLADLAGLELTWSAGYEVVSTADVRRLIPPDDLRRSTDCATDPSCLAALSKELQADFILYGSLGTVGHDIVLSLSLRETAGPVSPRGAVETIAQIGDLGKAVSRCLMKLFRAESAKVAAFRLPKGKSQSFAVLEIKQSGVASDTVQNLTQELSVEVKGIEGASVISRDDIAAMLQLSAAKMAVGCADEGCMAEIGGALGVDWLITGDVGKQGATYLVSLQLVDVRHARVENRVTESYQGDEEQLLRAVRSAARKLLGVEQTGAGRLAVTSSQPSSVVAVDAVVRGPPPIAIDKLSVGQHALRISRDGYFDWQSDVYVDRGETTAVWAQLRARPQSWYQKWWVWTIVGAVVIGGTTAAVAVAHSPPIPTVGSAHVTLPSL